MGVTQVGQSPVCTPFNGSVVRVKYTLEGSSPSSAFPSVALTNSPVAVAGYSSSVTALLTSGNTPFYLIACFAAAYGIVAICVYLARLNDVENKIFQIPLLNILFTMVLLGSAFISEMFLVRVMLQSEAFAYLGIIILVGRLCHIFFTVYVILCLFGPAKFSARYAKLLDSKNLMLEIRVYSIILLFACYEAPLNRFLPWVATEFSKQSTGYPDFRMFVSR